ncbi:hypothetical protein Zm00014a_010084 [Zea mays]|uniref:Uncharacterized protein n=1 Tax=Zea mays TaxID=4577 RepID=A0A3L6GE01_MAIZE|nr:hypothetical protein Zm00014a_010084 [Zea mays]
MVCYFYLFAESLLKCILTFRLISSHFIFIIR